MGGVVSCYYKTEDLDFEILQYIPGTSLINNIAIGDDYLYATESYLGAMYACDEDLDERCYALITNHELLLGSGTSAQMHQEPTASSI
jgi:hypothetical protein